MYKPNPDYTHNIASKTRRKNKPTCGGLFRSKRNSNGRYRIREGDIVMVVSPFPYLKDKAYTKVDNNNKKTVTTVQVWTDLVILHNETTINLDGSTEATWYYWFEKIELI